MDDWRKIAGADVTVSVHAKDVITWRLAPACCESSPALPAALIDESVTATGLAIAFPCEMFWPLTLSDVPAMVAVIRSRSPDSEVVGSTADPKDVYAPATILSTESCGFPVPSSLKYARYLVSATVSTRSISPVKSVA